MASGISGAISPSATPGFTVAAAGAPIVVDGPHPYNTAPSPFTNPGSTSMLTLCEPEMQFAFAPNEKAVGRAPYDVISLNPFGPLLLEGPATNIVAVAVFVLSARDVAVNVTIEEFGGNAGAVYRAETGVQAGREPQAGLHGAPASANVHMTPLSWLSFKTEALN